MGTTLRHLAAVAHDRIYEGYQMKLERTWLVMTRTLVNHEIVHIIAKNEKHQEHIAYLLNYHGIDSQNIDLRVMPSDDVWVRDNGPIFIVNNQGDLAVTDWNFNGWGGRFNHPQDAQVSVCIAEQLSLSIFTPPLVMEGGCIGKWSWHILGDGECTMLIDGEALFALDRKTGQRRLAIQTDWLETTRLIEAMDEIGQYWSMVELPDEGDNGSHAGQINYWQPTNRCP
jgi:agmatine/peptidylarginine deiminase